MAKTEYVVLKGRKYVGRHKVYKEGEKFMGEELFGNDENIKMALDGGGPNDAAPRIKLVTSTKQGKKKDAAKKDKNK